MTRLKKGDTVVVLAGADRGKSGKATVEGVNLKWKHMRRSQENPQGGRSRREYPLQTSNLAFWDAASSKGVRLGVEVQDGKKVRVMRPSGKAIEE
jgi:large subunit ribosomal protein L24